MKKPLEGLDENNANKPNPTNKKKKMQSKNLTNKQKKNKTKKEPIIRVVIY